jgi:hypothetical protein
MRYYVYKEFMQTAFVYFIEILEFYHYEHFYEKLITFDEESEKGMMEKFNDVFEEKMIWSALPHYFVLYKVFIKTLYSYQNFIDSYCEYETQLFVNVFDFFFVDYASVLYVESEEEQSEEDSLEAYFDLYAFFFKWLKKYFFGVFVGEATFGMCPIDYYIWWIGCYRNKMDVVGIADFDFIDEANDESFFMFCSGLFAKFYAKEVLRLDFVLVFEIYTESVLNFIMQSPVLNVYMFFFVKKKYITNLTYVRYIFFFYYIWSEGLSLKRELWEQLMIQN